MHPTASTIVKFALSSGSLRLRKGPLGIQGVIAIRGERDVFILHMEILEMIEVIQTFLDLAIEPRVAILSLGVLNLGVASLFGLDSNILNHEGGGSYVFYILDEGVVFAVFYQMADR